jgi:hypothetical protein
MKKTIWTGLVVLLLLSGGVVFGDEKKRTFVEGRIEAIKRDNLLMNGNVYTVIHPLNKDLIAKLGFETECWVVQSTERYMITLDTILSVGQVNLARIEITKDGVVRTIEVLQMLQ